MRSIQVQPVSESLQGGIGQIYVSCQSMNHRGRKSLITLAKEKVYDEMDVGRQTSIDREIRALIAHHGVTK